MTKQESFKRRIRERMSRTGERYTVARQALIAKADGGRRRTWVAEPEAGDDAVKTATGRGWDDWCDIIDGWSGRHDGHTAIAAYLQSELAVDPWWAQQVTGGYERITGLRLPYQRPDGTFTAGKSQTVHGDADALRRLLLDGKARADLFPGHPTELRSRPTAKSIRLAIGPGVAQFAIAPVDESSNGETGERVDQRVKVNVSHEKLPTYELVEEWKFYWTEWLDAIDQRPG